MKVYKRGFEKKWEDTIAVVYRIGKKGKSPIKLKHQTYYELFDNESYLIICGLQEFRVENGIITRTFCSIRHPFKKLNL